MSNEIERAREWLIERVRALKDGAGGMDGGGK